MRVSLVRDSSEFEALRSDWDRLAGEFVFRSWAWNFSWWQAFQTDRELFALACRDDADTIVGIAPWYIANHPALGRVIRFLGTGKACGEYLGMLCRDVDAPEVGNAVADWLVSTRRHPWDAIELEAVAADDVGIACLINELKQRRASVTSEPGMSCWRIDLPPTWDELLSRLSKLDRRKTRCGFRDLVDTGRAVLRVAEDPREVEAMYQDFKVLHTRRRSAVGGDHCFQTVGFELFLSSVLPRMMDTGRLSLATLDIDGQTAAISVGFCSRDVYHMYQCGMDPDLGQHSPGWLLNTMNIRACIEKGIQAFDFLRGDEHYKSRLSANPVAIVQHRVTAPKALSRLRSRIWSTGQSLKKIGKSFVRP